MNGGERIEKKVMFHWSHSSGSKKSGKERERERVLNQQQGTKVRKWTEKDIGESDEGRTKDG